jgi:hypothetical protein
MILNSRFYSSFIFLTNAILGFWYEYYTYSILFLILTVTSLIVHYNDNIYTNIIDKISVLLIVLYGGYLIYNKSITYNHNFYHYIFIFLILLTFLITIYLYAYGYCYNKYCFYEDSNISDIYHSIMHIISSFGHHLIILL